MKKLFLIFSALFIAVSSQAGKVVTDSLRSKVLDAEIKFNVYLPDGFDAGKREYPVVYLLHGLSGNYKEWKDRGSVMMVADELIRCSEADEMVIVMPNAGGKDVHNIPNGYFNMPGWNYEDFFFNEFMPAVESKYRCISDKGHRAIMGLSMGGGGSTVYCQRHPDMFSSCYAMSAWLDNDESGIKSEDAVKDCLYYTCKSVCDHSAVKFVAQSDEQTQEALRTVAWYFDCGDDDSLLRLSFDIHMLMSERGIKNELRVRDGIHNWEYWHGALRLALPFASRHFERTTPRP